MGTADKQHCRPAMIQNEDNDTSVSAACVNAGYGRFGLEFMSVTPYMILVAEKEVSAYMLRGTPNPNSKTVPKGTPAGIGIKIPLTPSKKKIIGG